MTTSHSEAKEQRIKLALKHVLVRQKEVIDLFEEILQTELPEGMTHLDVLCERLERVKNGEATKK